MPPISSEEHEALVQLKDGLDLTEGGTLPAGSPSAITLNKLASKGLIVLIDRGGLDESWVLTYDGQRYLEPNPWP